MQFAANRKQCCMCTCVCVRAATQQSRVYHKHDFSLAHFCSLANNRQSAPMNTHSRAHHICFPLALLLMHEQNLQLYSSRATKASFSMRLEARHTQIIQFKRASSWPNDRLKNAVVHGNVVSCRPMWPTLTAAVNVRLRFSLFACVFSPLQTLVVLQARVFICETRNRLSIWKLYC